MNPIVLLGTDGSGASTLAAALTELGVRFGARFGENTPPPEKAEPDKSESGTSEHGDRALDRMNARCLATFEMHPGGVCRLPRNWQSYPEGASFRKLARDSLRQLSQQGELWGIDARFTSLLLPLYLAVFEELELTPFFVLCVRNPDSEYHRMVTPPTAIGAWLSTVLGTLSELHPRTPAVVVYEDLSRDAESVLRRVFEIWNERFPANVTLFKAATGAVADLVPSSKNTEVPEICPSIAARTFALCLALSQGENMAAEAKELIDEFESWRELLAPPLPPGTQIGFVWSERGETQLVQAPFLPSGDWQTVEIAMSPPPGVVVSGLMYGQPCRVWLKKCNWRFENTAEAAKISPGPGSQLTNLDGLLRLDGAYEAEQISLMTPSKPGPYVLELEFLLEIGPQITVETANRLSDRLQKCAASHRNLKQALEVGQRERLVSQK